MIKSNWYEEWFNESYLNLYHQRNGIDAQIQIDLIEKIIPIKKTSRLLDLCCGYGRHTQIFYRRGYENIVGIDLSSYLINLAKKNNPNIEFKIGDMRELNGYYDIILSLFTSFGYFESKDDNFKVLKNIYNALNDKGYFWFDFLNKEYVIKNIVVQTTSSYKDIQFIQKRLIKKNRIIKNITQIKDNEKKYFRESVYLYSFEEIKDMILSLGFNIHNIFGDYLGNSYYKDAKRMIVFAQKIKHK